MLNLFLALLLSSFGGDALKGEEDEGSTEKKKTRLQRLIEWTKKRRKKKFSDEGTKDADPNMVSRLRIHFSNKSYDHIIIYIHIYWYLFPQLFAFTFTYVMVISIDARHYKSRYAFRPYVVRITILSEDCCYMI